MIDVSCIIPVFNDADNLPRAVESCIAQGENVEVVVVDDCSADNSFRIAQELATFSSGRVRAFKNVQNSGPAFSRNHGAFHSRGAYVCFLDSDDSYLHGFVDHCVSLLTHESKTAAVKTLIDIVNSAGDSPLDKEDPRFSVVVATYPCNMMVRKEVFLAMGGFPTDVRFRGPLAGEDDAFMKTLGHLFHSIKLVRKTLVRHNNHSGSHLELFLSRTRVEDGKIIFDEDDPTLKVGEVVAATQDYFLRAQSNLRSLLQCATVSKE